MAGALTTGSVDWALDIGLGWLVRRSALWVAPLWDWLRKEANGDAYWAERAEAAFANGPEAVQAEVDAWQAEFSSSPAGRSKPPGVPVSTATDRDRR